MDYFKFDGAEIEVVSAVNRYGTLPIRYYDDLNLSPKAWGILGKIFLLKSRNENWKISVNGLATQIKGGRDLVKSTVKDFTFFPSALNTSIPKCGVTLLPPLTSALTVVASWIGVI